MKRILQCLPPSSTDALVANLGQRWTGIGGTKMPQPNFSWTELFVATESSNLRFFVEMIPRNFEGESTEYPELKLESPPAGFITAVAAGKAYFQGRGEKICAIWLLRDSVRCTEASTAQFEFVVDVGVVFQLETDCVAVTVASFVSDGLSVLRADCRENLEIARLEDFWQSELTIRYDYSRQWILLAGNPEDA